MNIQDISRMSTAERLQAMEALWDSLTHNMSDVNAPGWHHDALSERRKKIENGTATFCSLDDLKSNSRK